MNDSTLFVPVRRLTTDPGYVPASPFIATDATRNYNRWSKYWLNPRTTIGPVQVGLHGVGACCANCAVGKPCLGGVCLGGVGMGGPVETIQRHTDGYGIPVLAGAAIGYLTEKKTGAVAGAIVGALAKWAYDRYVGPWVGAVTQMGGLGGFTDDFRFNPPMTDADTPMDRAWFRTVQALLVIGGVTLALKFGKPMVRGWMRNPKRRCRNARKSRKGDRVMNSKRSVARLSDLSEPVVLSVWRRINRGTSSSLVVVKYANRPGLMGTIVFLEDDASDPVEQLVQESGLPRGLIRLARALLRRALADPAPFVEYSLRVDPR